MSRPRAAIVIAVLAVIAAASTATLALARTSSAVFWSGAKGTVVCGIQSHPRHTQARWLLCAANGVPRAKGGGTAGYAFVRIAAGGRARLLVLTKTSFVGALQGHIPTPLRSGVTWSSLGVSCRTAPKTVRCSNGSRHGFTIGNGEWRPF